MATRRQRTTRTSRDWRLFIAVPIPLPVRQLIAEAQDQLASWELPFRWVDPDIAHITLKFLGDTNPRAVPELAEKVRWAAGRTRPLDLRTGSIGAFPTTRRPRVAWLGLDGDSVGLERLADDVDEVAVELGYRPERRRFQPHVTLGRLRRGDDPPSEFELAINGSVLPSCEFGVDRVQLLRSVLTPSGPEYSVIDEWHLGQEARSPRALNHG